MSVRINGLTGIELPDNAHIGSTSDTDSIKFPANGSVEFTQTAKFKDSLFMGTGDIVNSNKFQDYEEGTWTPALEGLATNASNGTVTTFSNQTGYYVKIGRLVFAYCSMTTSAMSMTGDFSGFQVNGLPFSSTSTDGDNVHNGSVNGSYDAISSSMLDGKHASVAGWYLYNTVIAATSTAGDGTILRYAEINQNGVKTFRGSFVYYTDA